MGTVTLTLPSDGQTIDASDVNNPLNTIANELNGNLDNSNIKTGAAIDRSKIAGFTDGWESLAYTPSTITYNGNRSYDLVFASNNLTTSISPGTRLKLTRTVTTPTGSISLNGSTQYASKSSPSGMTFTDDFVVSAWVKLSSYALGCIASRWNGTSGWTFDVLATGQIRLEGTKGGAGNSSRVDSYQSIPLNKWVHVTAQLDMSAFTATSTTSYIMIDGVDVPSTVGRSGTNPTDLTQAGNLEIGGANGGTLPFPGQIAQVAIYSAKVTQATIKASSTQTLTGSETSLVSAYKLDQASGLTDLSANANNLTATGSPSYATDTPFTQTLTGVTTGTTNYAIVQKAAFSTNTTLTVQVAEGDTIPTSGGVSAVSYSQMKAPYGFPAQEDKWRIDMLALSRQSAAGTGSNSWQNLGFQLSFPVGNWRWAYGAKAAFTHAGSTFLGGGLGISTGSTTLSEPYSASNTALISTSTTESDGYCAATGHLALSAQTVYYWNISPSQNSTTVYMGDSTSGRGAYFYAVNAYL